MDVSYYPGCSLKGMAKEYDESTQTVAALLGIRFHELDDWTCCGASSAHATSEALATSLPARNIEIAEKTGMDLVVPCASCFQRLKQAEKQLLLNRKTPGDGKGNLRIRHLVDFFWDDVGEKVLKEKIKRPLHGLKPVCYYGCLTSRPPRVTDTTEPEHPEAMDNLVKALGAEVKNWSYKTDCCGGNLAFTLPDVAASLRDKLLDMAAEAGANCIVTGCPLCQSNLDMGQYQVPRSSRKHNLPVFYFTELMGLAFGEPTGKWLRGHMIDPKPLLRQLKLSRSAA